MRHLAIDGAKFETLRDVSTRITDGSHNPPTASEDGQFPMISARNVNGGRIDFDGARLLSASDFAIENRRTQARRGDVVLTIVGTIGRTAVINTDHPMVFQRSVCLIRPDESRLDSKFLSYALQGRALQEAIANQANGGAQKGIYLGQVERLKIPVPPLAAQKEIVEILDNFTNLEAELDAELEARRRQCDYYRDALLNGPDAPDARVPIGEILQIKFGSRITKAANSGINYPVYGGGGESFRTDSFNRENEWIVSRFAMSRTCVRRVSGRFWMLDSGFTFDVVRPGVNKDFIGQALLHMQPTIFATSTQSAQKNIDIKGFKRLTIALPPLPEQLRIASVLGSFDALVSDPNFGLPAEIRARRQQYEYYRDKLLTFPEAAA